MKYHFLRRAQFEPCRGAFLQKNETVDSKILIVLLAVLLEAALDPALVVLAPEGAPGRDDALAAAPDLPAPAVVALALPPDEPVASGEPPAAASSAATAATATPSEAAAPTDSDAGPTAAASDERHAALQAPEAAAFGGFENPNVALATASRFRTCASLLKNLFVVGLGSADSGYIRIRAVVPVSASTARQRAQVRRDLREAAEVDFGAQQGSIGAVRLTERRTEIWVRIDARRIFVQSFFSAKGGALYHQRRRGRNGDRQHNKRRRTANEAHALFFARYSISSRMMNRLCRMQYMLSRAQCA